MFGYVRPAMGRLSEDEQRRYRALYCGLCHTLSERCGFSSRFILNFDFTFLAALLSDSCDCRSCRCVASPLKKKECVCTDGALALSADCSVIFTWYKLLDEIADGTFARRQLSRAAMAALHGAYKKAAAARPKFNAAVEREMQRLHILEEGRCPSLDESADTFARILESVTLELEEDSRRRILAQLLYHLGRWIYLVDALDDWKEDLKSGNYNPLIVRFSLTGDTFSEEVSRRVCITLDASIRAMAAAFELLERSVWSTIIESAVYDGLYSVGHAVLDGTFHAGDWKDYFLGKKEQL